MTQTNLVPELFPNPQKRGIYMEPVCWDLEFHIWRMLLDLLKSGEPLTVFDAQAKGFQDKKVRTNESFLLSNSHFQNQTVALKGDTPGVITYDFPTSDRHIMRAVMAKTRRLKKEQMLTSLEKSETANQDLLKELINEDSDNWFGAVFVEMLTRVGYGLSIQEREQLLTNILWFDQAYKK